MRKSVCIQPDTGTHATLFMVLLGLAWAGCVRSLDVDKLTCSRHESCPKDYFCSLQGSGEGKCVLGSRTDASVGNDSRGEVGHVPADDALLLPRDGASEVGRAGGTDAAGTLPATGGVSGTGNTGAGTGGTVVDSSQAGGAGSGGVGGSGLDAGSTGAVSSQGGFGGGAGATGGSGGAASKQDAGADASAPAANGARCERDGDCAKGNCVDGVCCDSKCSGQCQACAEPGSEGTCKTVTGAPRGLRTACEGGGSVCGGRCDGQSLECTYPSNKTSCGEVGCNVDFTSLTSHACNSHGSCEETTILDCSSSGQICLAGACAPKVATGGTCQGFGQCKDGHFCCWDKCDGLNDSSDCGKCIDVLNDSLNCGKCGMVCPYGQTCNGEGRCACPEGTTTCRGNECVDILSSDGHCGASCTSCYPQAGHVCSEGKCVCAGKVVEGCGCLAWNFNNGSAQGWGPSYSLDKTMCNDFVAGVGGADGLESTLDGTQYLYASFQGSDCVAPMGINFCSTGTALNGLSFSARVRFSAPFSGSIFLWTTNNPNIATDFALATHPAGTWHTVKASIADSGLDTQFGLTFQLAAGANWNGTAMIDNVIIK